MKLRLSAVVLLVLLTSVGIRAQDRCEPPYGRHAPTVHVSATTRSALQSAVCAVADHGTIFLARGVYHEQIVITHKRVTIVGEGHPNQPEDWPQLRADTPETLVPAERAEGTITVGDGASVTMRQIRFVGGDAQIRVVGGAQSVDVTNASFEGGWRGVLHTSPSAALDVSFARFVDQQWNGITFSPHLAGMICVRKLHVSHTFFGYQQNVGVLIKNCQPGDIGEGEALVLGLMLQGLDLQGQGGGGLLLYNSGPFHFVDIDVSNAATFGIAAMGSSFSLNKGVIQNTLPRPADGKGGDGIMLVPLGSAPDGRRSELGLTNFEIYNSARASIGNFGGAVTFTNITMGGAAFCLNGEDVNGFVDEWQSGGGVLCSNDPANEPYDECAVLTSSVTPPPDLSADP
jgi:hypothetical protein